MRVQFGADLFREYKSFVNSCCSGKKAYVSSSLRNYSVVWVFIIIHEAIVVDLLGQSSRNYWTLQAP